MRISSRFISMAGPKGDNQDNLLLPIEVDGRWWTAIADGVGGSDRGGLASKTCVESVKEICRQQPSMPDLFSEVWARLKSVASSQKAGTKMSSTLTVLKLDATKGWIGHVGDTRVTHYRTGGVMIRTHDQTEVQRLLDEGALSPQQAARYPRRNVILSAMTPDRQFELFEAEFAIRKGDRILLTTDGFHSVLHRRSISEISESCPDFEDFFLEIERRLAAAKLVDDATCLAIEIA